MTRRPRKLRIDTSRRKVLEPADITPDMVALGWRYEGRESAGRYDPDGSPTAYAIADLRRDDAGRWFVVWTGGLERPRRKLKEVFGDAPTTIRAVETAEANGPLSDDWEGQSGAPGRDGWEHTVRQKRDVWFRVTPCGRQLVVLQAPLKPGGRLGYMAAIDGEFIKRDGKSRWFNNPIDAMVMVEVEVEILDRHATTAEPETLTE